MNFDVIGMEIMSNILERVRFKLTKRLMLRKSRLSDKFSEIYDSHLWPSAESRSGRGSEVAFTENLRAWLIKKTRELDVQYFVDVPCGDFNWMKLVVAECDFEYLGMDIVESVIKDNKVKFESEKIKFQTADLTKDAIPACDLLMIRDCLFHLSFSDIDLALKNIASVDYKYLLTTTHIVSKESLVNTDIVSGDWRLIDLFQPPFSFPAAQVMDVVHDYPIGFPTQRKMILIHKNDVPTCLAL